MDLISKLPDELLLRILSQLPTTNEVVATMVLSKRWKFLWKMVPKLVYIDSRKINIEYARFSRFVDRSLLLHEAPVIETLQFDLCETCPMDDIVVWIRAADKLNVRKLIFEYNDLSHQHRAILPRSFYTGCRMLVELTLFFVILVDVVASPISFPSLKNLDLICVKYPSTEFFNRFLSNCLVLEALYMYQLPYDNVSICTVRVPSLKSLTVHRFDGRDDDADGFVIDAPSLVKLDITDDNKYGFCVIENEIPMIITVVVDIKRYNIGNILGSVTSVKRLCLCLSTAKDPYPVGSVFHQLVSLSLCRCNEQWLNLLMRVLEGSPKLRCLTLNQCYRKPRPCWIKPSSVPDCVLSNLETLEWKKYEGAEEGVELVQYILRNGTCLKKVTISSQSTDDKVNLEMLKLLTLSARRSPNCQFVFN